MPTKLVENSALRHSMTWQPVCASLPSGIEKMGGYKKTSKALKSLGGLECHQAKSASESCQ